MTDIYYFCFRVFVHKALLVDVPVAILFLTVDCCGDEMTFSPFLLYASFRCVHRLGYMTVSEMLETMHENDPFNIFPEFSKMAHILAALVTAL